MSTLFRYQDPSGAVLLISQREDGAVDVELFGNTGCASVAVPPAEAQGLLMVQAWPGGGTAPHPSFHQLRMWQHVCGHVESWDEGRQGPINDQGCDACESAPFLNAWQPLFRKADSYPVSGR